MQNKKWKFYLWLAGINLFISAFTFGGGYIVVPMLRKYYVCQKKLFSEDDLLNMAAVANSTPGAIAINLTALAGYKAAGCIGILISCIAAILPPLIILSVISGWYSAFAANPVINAMLKGMQAGVAAVIVDLVIDMTIAVTKERSVLLNLMIPSVFAANFFFHANIILILILCCGLCVLRTVFYQKRRV